MPCCRELTPLGHLRSFDYAYQNNQEIFAPDAKVLLPGDSLSLQVCAAELSDGQTPMHASIMLS